jgi:hypothetical protein
LTTPNTAEMTDERRQILLTLKSSNAGKFWVKDGDSLVLDATLIHA